MKKMVGFILAVLVLQRAILGQEVSENVQPSAYEVITNPFRDDGFGAQFQTIIYSAIYADLNNKEFIYTPFKTMEHNYDNNLKFLEYKEWLINFIGNFKTNDNLIIQPHNHPEYHSFFENNLILCANSHSLKKIKEVFRANKNKRDYFNPEKLNIAIHLRRPNPHDNRLQGADIPDEEYLRIINLLRCNYPSGNRLIHIYSQGDIKAFVSRYSSDDIVLHINESIEETFSSMVLADVLVTSASSLSYAAGIISEGTVYYIPFWHPPLPSWIVLN